MKVRNNLPKIMGEHRIKSLRSLSVEIDIPYQTLLNFYHERYETFNADLIKKLCSHFNCNIEDLLYLEKRD